MLQNQPWTPQRRRTCPFALWSKCGPQRPFALSASLRGITDIATVFAGLSLSIVDPPVVLLVSYDCTCVSRSASR